MDDYSAMVRAARPFVKVLIDEARAMYHNLRDRLQESWDGLNADFLGVKRGDHQTLNQLRAAHAKVLKAVTPRLGDEGVERLRARYSATLDVIQSELVAKYGATIMEEERRIQLVDAGANELLDWAQESYDNVPILGAAAVYEEVAAYLLSMADIRLTLMDMMTRTLCDVMEGVLPAKAVEAARDATQEDRDKIPDGLLQLYRLTRRPLRGYDKKGKPLTAKQQRKLAKREAKKQAKKEAEAAAKGEGKEGPDGAGTEGLDAGWASRSSVSTLTADSGRTGGAKKRRRKKQRRRPGALRLSKSATQGSLSARKARPGGLEQQRSRASTATGNSRDHGASAQSLGNPFLERKRTKKDILKPPTVWLSDTTLQQTLTGEFKLERPTHEEISKRTAKYRELPFSPIVTLKGRPRVWGRTKTPHIAGRGQRVIQQSGAPGFFNLPTAVREAGPGAVRGGVFLPSMPGKLETKALTWEQVKRMQGKARLAEMSAVRVAEASSTARSEGAPSNLSGSGRGEGAAGTSSVDVT